MISPTSTLFPSTTTTFENHPLFEHLHYQLAFVVAGAPGATKCKLATVRFCKASQTLPLVLRHCDIEALSLLGLFDRYVILKDTLSAGRNCIFFGGRPGSAELLIAGKCRCYPGET